MLSALFLLGTLAAAPAAAPQALPPTPRFRHYGVNEGLPSSRIYSTIQDEAGYLWVGTGDGLARFDGQSFKLYRHDPARAQSLPNNDISALLLARDGRLWVGGEGTGLNRLRRDGAGFDQWQHDPADPDSLSGNDVMGLAEGASGQIWVGVYAGGVSRLRADGRGFDHWRHDADNAASLASDNVMSLHASASGRAWVGTDAGLDLIDTDDRLRHIEFVGLEQAPWVWQIRGADGDIRVSTGAGLFRVGNDLRAHRWPAGKEGHGETLATLRDRTGDVWIAERGGLRLLAAGGTEHEIPVQPMVPGGLPAQLVVDMYADDEGGLWFSSVDAGLLYLSPDWRDFSRFSHYPEDADSLRGNKVIALAEAPDGMLVVGGIGGQLDRLDPGSGRAEPVPGSATLPATSMISLAADAAGVWAGTQSGLFRVEPGGAERVAEPELHVPVRYLLQWTGGLLAAPIARPVYQIAAPGAPARPLGLAFAADADRLTLSLLRVGDSAWRSSEAGLSRLDAGADAFVPVPGVAPGRINSFAVRGDRLWLARPDALEVYALEGARARLLRRVGADAGFPAIEIMRIFIDANGRVWLTSRVGLWRFDPERGRFRVYGAVDGLPSAEFSSTLVQRPDGTVFAGTLEGVAGFVPARLTDHARQPRMQLREVSALRDGRRTALAAADDGSLHLAWDARALRVAVQALSYVDPAGLHYRFRMRNFDADWVDTGPLGARDFTGLGPGHYELKVQAAGASGRWAELPAPLRFDVAVPPWRTPLALAAYVLGVLALLALLWHQQRLRLRRRLELRLLERQRQLAEEASQAKTRFLATMGHEIRTPMTGMLGMAELLSRTDLAPRQQDMVGTIRHSGAALFKLVNEALDLARIEAGRLQLEPAPFDPCALAREVIELSRGVAADKGLELTLECAADVPAQVLGDGLRVRQIILNLVSNALKFTETGGVALQLDHDGERLRCRVRDSGPGMDAALQARLFRRFEQGRNSSSGDGTGLGLAICRELAQLMGGEVTVSSRPGQGSTFTAQLPLPPVAALVAAPVPAAVPAPASRRRVLLVEDDPVIARVLAGLLEEDGHAVSRAGDALAALAELEIAPRDTLVVDIDLPGLDGFELVRLARARADGPGLHILVVTARVDPGDEARARAAGADAFLRKPLTGAQLRRALDRIGQERGPQGPRR